MNYASRKEQIRVYIGKCFRSYFNEMGWKSLLSAIVIPLLALLVVGEKGFKIDMMSVGKTKTLGFIIVCACIWVGIFNSLQSICKERGIVKHEYRAGLDLTAYIMAHMIFEMILCFVEAIIMFGIVAVRYHKNFANLGELTFFRYIALFITLFLVTYAADALGIMVSSIVKNAGISLYIMPFLLVIQLIFAGNISLSNKPLQTVSMFVVSKWGYDAFLNLSTIEEKFMYVEKGGFENYNNTVNFALCWLVLILFVVVYGLLARFFIKGVEKDKR